MLLFDNNQRLENYVNVTKINEFSLLWIMHPICEIGVKQQTFVTSLAIRDQRDWAERRARNKKQSKFSFWIRKWRKFWLIVWCSAVFYTETFSLFNFSRIRSLLKWSNVQCSSPSLQWINGYQTKGRCGQNLGMISPKIVKWKRNYKMILAHCILDLGFGIGS